MSRLVRNERKRRFFVIPVVTLLEDRCNVGETLLGALVTDFALEQIDAPPPTNDYLSQTAVAPASGFSEDERPETYQTESWFTPEKRLPLATVQRDPDPLQVWKVEQDALFGDFSDAFDLSDDLLDLVSRAPQGGPSYTSQNHRRDLNSYQPPAAEPQLSSPLAVQPAPFDPPAWQGPSSRGPQPGGGDPLDGGQFGPSGDGGEPLSPPGGDLPVVTIEATDALAIESTFDPGEFTISRTGSTFQDLWVGFSIAGTADFGQDYRPFPDFIVIPAGQDSVARAISPSADGETEPDETVVLTLRPSPQYTIGSPDQANVVLADEPPAETPVVTVQATDPNAAEEGPDAGGWTVYRTGDLGDTLTVCYTISGSATPGVDYESLSGSVTIPTGAAEQTLPLWPIPDSEGEPDETVVLTLDSGYPSYTVGRPASATVIITDDVSDAQWTVFVYVGYDTAEWTNIYWPDGAFTLARSGSASAWTPLTINYELDGTAIRGSDFVELPGSLTVPPGYYMFWDYVSALDDALMEGWEYVTLTILPGDGYVIGEPASWTIWIADDEPWAEVDTATTTEETAVTIDVVANDEDPWGGFTGPLTVVEVELPLYGSVVINPDNTVTYTPNGNAFLENAGHGFYGLDQFSYTISNGHSTGSNIVWVTVDPVDNIAPVANDDEFYTDIDTAREILAAELLGNDSDANGDRIELEIVEGPSDGTLVTNGAGRWTYTPNPGFTGTDVFIYRLYDGATRSGIAFGAIGVGQQPTTQRGPAWQVKSGETVVGLVQSLYKGGLMSARFITSSSIADTAKLFGGHHFNWYQIVTADTHPPPDAKGTPLQVPYVNLPPGGSKQGNVLNWADDLPWAFHEIKVPNNTFSSMPFVLEKGTPDKPVTTDRELFFGDTPMQPGANATTSFKTWLVCVDEKSQLKSWHGGFSWDWTNVGGNRVSNVNKLDANPTDAEFSDLIKRMKFKTSL